MRGVPEGGLADAKGETVKTGARLLREVPPGTALRMLVPTIAQEPSEGKLNVRISLAGLGGATATVAMYDRVDPSCAVMT